MAGTIRDMLTSGSAKPERSKKGVTEAMRNLLLGAEQEQGRRAMEHTEPQRHDVKRLPHYAKQAGLGWLAGVPGYIGDTLNLVQSAADVIPGMGPMRNRPPVGGTTESIGDMLGADTKSGAFQLGAMGAPDMNDVVRLSALLAPITWHGSPHKFAPTDRSVLGEFDSRKIGTGEGAQSYGYGLYLADEPGVASNYKIAGPSGGGYDKFVAGKPYDSSDPVHLASNYWDMFWPRGRSRQEIADILINEGGTDVHKAAADLILNGSPRGPKFTHGIPPLEKVTRAHLYKVDLPDEMIPRMLDWDAPLSEQPESVKRALKEAFPKELEASPFSTGRQFYRRMADSHLLPPEFRGRGEAGVSEFLNSQGIPGIRFYDGASRSAKEGTRNIVVFNPDDITQVKRDGELVHKAK